MVETGEILNQDIHFWYFDVQCLFIPIFDLVFTLDLFILYYYIRLKKGALERH